MKPLNVLIIYDTPGWAWWNKIDQIEKNISPVIRVHRAAIGEFFQPDRYDFIVTFSPYVRPFLKFVPPVKIILGCTSPLNLNLLLEAMSGHLCVGGFVNSLEMYENAQYKENLYCCQNGVDADLFFPAKEPVKELTACWVGNSESVHKKGLDLAKEACLLANVPLNYLDRRPLNKDANLLTPIQVREQIYHRSSFYICASEVDATPNSCLEALACGLPVISTRVGNMLELIEDGYNGFLVNRDLKSIGAAIEKLKKMNSQEMGENARASIMKEWTWKEQVKKYEHMFLDLAAKREKIADKSMMAPMPLDYRDYFQLGKRCFKQEYFDSAETWFLEVIKFEDLPLSTESETYFYLGNIGETRKRPGWQRDLEKYFQLAGKKTNKTIGDIYRMASVSKRLGKTEDAEQLFNRVLTEPGGDKWKGGVYFHLGEIQLRLENKKKAAHFFKQCLELEPGHKKAARYLQHLDFAGSKN